MIKKEKIVWIINPYGNLPNEAWSKYRAQLIAEAFNEVDIKVLWFTSNFNHRSKTFRDNLNSISTNKNFKIILLETKGYYSNVSFSRIKFEMEFARRFIDEIKINNYSKPINAIVIEPSPFYSKKIQNFLIKKNIDYSIDVLDLWPEIFKIYFPKPFFWLYEIIFSILKRRRLNFAKHSSLLIGASEDYLYPYKKLNKPKIISYIGYSDQQLKSDLIRQTRLDLSPLDLNIIYAGTFGINYDIKTVFKTAKKIKHLNIKFFFIGKGEILDWMVNYKKKNNLNNIQIHESISVSDLHNLYKYFDIGLSSYQKHSSVSMPLKFYDYLKFSIPILNSLEGEISRLISSNNIGVNYRAEDVLDLSNKLEELSKNRKIIKKFSNNFSKIKMNFSAKNQHVKIVDEILKITSDE